MNDNISRKDAINALWKALYEYEDKTEKQFLESEELDAGDWMVHRIFVQNMSDIDRQTILNLPSAQPEIIHCRECEYGEKDDSGRYFCRDLCCQMGDVWGNGFCSDAERRTDGTEDTD